MPSPARTISTSTEPQPGDVIRYFYLWRHEHNRGEEDGSKLRPCMVVATFRYQGRLRVLTVPLTTRDYSPVHSIELPPRFLKAFGLDDRSRLVWNDVNEFTWVGPDVRAGPDGNRILAAVPATIVERVKAKIVEHRVPVTRRTE